MNTLTTKNKLLLFLSYYICWLLAAYMGRLQMSAFAFVAPLLFYFISRKFYKLHWAFVGLFFVGVLFDFIALKLGWVVPTESSYVGLPFWLLSIWMVYVLSLPLFLNFLNQRYVLSGFLGAVFGPLSYRSGVSLEVLQIQNNITYLYYGLFWALYFPLCIYVLNATNSPVNSPHNN